MRTVLFRSLSIFLLISGLAAPAFAQNQAIDPPARVGRLSFTSGQVSLQAPGDTDWSTAPLNYPVSNGTNLWVDPAGPAEIEIGPDRITLDGGTELDVTSLDDAVMGFNLPQGSMVVRLGAVNRGEQVEIGTPRGLVQLMQVGRYRIDAGSQDEPTRITVLQGEAQLVGDNSSQTIRAGQAGVLRGEDRVSFALETAQPSDLDRFADSRETKFRGNPPPAPAQMTGVSDLSLYGQWASDPAYGQVWYPTDLPSDWAPYSYGHWAWISPWGWTWIDDAPWGFAPFHYGRWIHASRGWGWYPGPAVSRPVFAPALVVFLGTPNRFSAGVRGPGVAWAPLAPREAYVPPFRTSSRFRVQINIGQTRSVVAPRSPRNAQFAVAQSHAARPIFRPAEAPRHAARVAASAPVSPRVERLHNEHPHGERVTPTAATTTGAPVRPAFNGRERTGTTNTVARPPEVQQRAEDQRRQEQQRQDQHRPSPAVASPDRQRGNRDARDHDGRDGRSAAPATVVAPSVQPPAATPQNHAEETRSRNGRDQDRQAPARATGAEPGNRAATEHERVRGPHQDQRNGQDRGPQSRPQERAAAPAVSAPATHPAPAAPQEQRLHTAAPRPPAASVPSQAPTPAVAPSRPPSEDQHRDQRRERPHPAPQAAPAAAPHVAPPTAPQPPAHAAPHSAPAPQPAAVRPPPPAPQPPKPPQAPAAAQAPHGAQPPHPPHPEQPHQKEQGKDKKEGG